MVVVVVVETIKMTVAASSRQEERRWDGEVTDIIIVAVENVMSMLV